jgi:hypothetical protein
MEEKIFYENPKVKVTNFTIETKEFGREFTMPTTQLIKVSSEVVGKGWSAIMMILMFAGFCSYTLFNMGIIPALVYLPFIYFAYVWMSNCYGVVLHTQARPRKYVVVEDIKHKEAEIIKGKIAEAMVENAKHRLDYSPGGTNRVAASIESDNTGYDPSGNAVMTKLADLKKLLDSGLITQQEYDAKKSELLSRF